MMLLMLGYLTIRQGEVETLILGPYSAPCMLFIDDVSKAEYDLTINAKVRHKKRISFFC